MNLAGCESNKNLFQFFDTSCFLAFLGNFEHAKF